MAEALTYPGGGVGTARSREGGVGGSQGQPRGGHSHRGGGRTTVSMVFGGGGLQRWPLRREEGQLAQVNLRIRLVWKTQVWLHYDSAPTPRSSVTLMEAFFEGMFVLFLILGDPG